MGSVCAEDPSGVSPHAPPHRAVLGLKLDLEAVFTKSPIRLTTSSLRLFSDACFSRPWNQSRSEHFRILGSLPGLTGIELEVGKL